MAEHIEADATATSSTNASPYRLTGPQVEPEASFWNQCPRPCPIALKDLVAWTDDPHNPHYFPPHSTDPTTIGNELEELKDLEPRRDDPTQIASTRPCRERLPISLFLQLRPVPLGAVVNTARGNAFPVVSTGSELARYFENETPGLAHRHALNLLIRDTNWSPPRQALIWAALDVTIFSALSAAWYYKWLSPRPDVSRRPRPVEVDRHLNVLYDFAVNSTGSGSNGKRPDFGGGYGFSPGTPRHPAYPSGHSTYAGAASELLSFFFPDYRREFDRLADNAGLARLWAGIHWRSDHVQGVNLGRAVACLVIEQLRKSGIPLVPARRPDDEEPPSREILEEQAKEFAENCGKATPGKVPGLSLPVSKPCVLIPPAGERSDVVESDKQGQSIVG